MDVTEYDQLWKEYLEDATYVLGAVAGTLWTENIVNTLSDTLDTIYAKYKEKCKFLPYIFVYVNMSMLHYYTLELKVGPPRP